MPFVISDDEVKPAAKGRFVIEDDTAPPAVKEPSWYERLASAVTMEDPRKPPGPVRDIIQSVPSSFARASAGLVGLPQAASDLLTSSLRGPSMLNTTLPGMFLRGAGAVSDMLPKVPNLGSMSLSGLKSLMGATYEEPQTTPGKIADFAAQNVLFGAKNPRDMLNAPKTLRSLVQGTTAGAAGESVPDDMPGLKMAAQVIGGFTPSAVEMGLKSSDRATKNAAKMIQQAMQGKTSAEWAAAEHLVNQSQRVDVALDQSQKVGVPLMGPEGFKGGSQIQQLASDVAASPVAGAKVREFTQDRAGQVEASVSQHLQRIGKDVGGQEAANRAQEVASEVLENAQKFRTESAGPKYRYQRASDAEALSLMDQIKKTQEDIKSGTMWKNDAISKAGQWYAFSHEMGLRANDLAARVKGWAGDRGVQKFMDRAKEGKDATYEAVQEARNRQNYIDQWQRDLESRADALASKNLPQIEGKVKSFLSKLDQEIRLANPNTTEGKILSAYREEIAPGGKPLVLPSQLESAYKATRDKLELGLQPTSLDRTTAGVLNGHVKSLDALIQDVSPAIREGRRIHREMSEQLVDPLFKGPIGKLAGKGADAQMEASYSRMISELQGKTATPKRIGEIADRFMSVDKTAFPNMTRAYLEEQLNTNLKDLQGRRNPAAGANFRNAVAGTPNERANLRTMIEKTAEAQGEDPHGVYAGFNNLLDVLDATGRVPGIGSQTQGRMENAAMARSNPVSGAIDVVSTAPTRSISKWVEDMYYRGTYKKLAEVFTAKDSIKQMRALALLKPEMPEAQRIVSTLLTSATQAAGNNQKAKDKAER